MFVIYVAFSIAGWVALGLFLSYWVGVISGKRMVLKESPATPPREVSP